MIVFNGGLWDTEYPGKVSDPLNVHVGEVMHSGL